MVHMSFNSDKNYSNTSSNSNNISCLFQAPSFDVKGGGSHHPEAERGWRSTEPRWRKSSHRVCIYLNRGHPGHTGGPGGQGWGLGSCPGRTDVVLMRNNDTPTGDTAAAPPGRSSKNSSPSLEPSPLSGPGTTPCAAPSLLKPPPSLLLLLHLLPPPPPHGGSSSASCWWGPSAWGRPLGPPGTSASPERASGCSCGPPAVSGAANTEGGTFIDSPETDVSLHAETRMTWQNVNTAHTFCKYPWRRSCKSSSSAYFLLK